MALREPYITFSHPRPLKGENHSFHLTDEDIEAGEAKVPLAEVGTRDSMAKAPDPRPAGPSPPARAPFLGQFLPGVPAVSE